MNAPYIPVVMAANQCFGCNKCFNILAKGYECKECRKTYCSRCMSSNSKLSVSTLWPSSRTEICNKCFTYEDSQIFCSFKSISSLNEGTYLPSADLADLSSISSSSQSGRNKRTKQSTRPPKKSYSSANTSFGQGKK